MKRGAIEKNHCLSSSLPLICVIFQRSDYAIYILMYSVDIEI